MAFTKEDLKALGLSDEQVTKVLTERGKEVEAEKKKYAEAEKKLNEKMEALNKLNADFNDLKEKSITSADFKQKFEELQKEVKDKEAKAEAERVEAQKAEAVAKRFVAVVGERKWKHDAIGESYRKKFEEEVAKEENIGKSDADIFNSLVKDDAEAFAGTQVQVMLKGSNGNADKALTKDEILNIKDATERRALMAQALKTDPHYFD